LELVTALERTDDLVIESGDHLPSVLATFTATSDTPRDDGGLLDLKSPALLRIAPWNPFEDVEALLQVAPSVGTLCTSSLRTDPYLDFSTKSTK